MYVCMMGKSERVVCQQQHQAEERNVLWDHLESTAETGKTLYEQQVNEYMYASLKRDATCVLLLLFSTTSSVYVCFPFESKAVCDLFFSY